ncbi:hypothetical protein DPMN_142639 [Dreissena polymorpha]|uniref:Uncharacterized protein n=1 Tax=Dreissena polymorpha TaxID=45954 RepID=A0A9D4GC15_DREPO|nr:hypothetical protein DPMN_142639 [Dreissena polymorpha]
MGLGTAGTITGDCLCGSLQQKYNYKLQDRGRFACEETSQEDEYGEDDVDYDGDAAADDDSVAAVAYDADDDKEDDKDDDDDDDDDDGVKDDDDDDEEKGMINIVVKTQDGCINSVADYIRKFKYGTLWSLHCAHYIIK